MFGAKITSIDDTVFDDKFYNEVAKSSGAKLDFGKTYVDKHFSEVKFTKFPICLPVVIRHLLLDIHKTKKMILKEQDVETNDSKIMINTLIMNVSMNRVDSKCDCDGFYLDVSNNDHNSAYDMETGKMYIYVNSRDIKFTKNGKVVDQRFINDMDICPLEYERRLRFSGIIEEQNSYSTNSIFKYTTSIYPLSLTKGNNGKLDYYNGSLTMVYIDNVKPVTLLKWAFEKLIEIIDSVEGEDMIEQFRGNYAITIPLDRSGVIAHFIDTYATMITSPKVVKIDKVGVAKETKMIFDIPRNEIEVLIKSTFNMIRQELNNLIHNL